MIRLCLLFVLSGSAALMLETVFLRQLAWLFGNSTTATVAVLSAFMAGMALGAACFGRLVDRRGAPLRVYAWLELGAALSGGGLAWLLGSGRQIFLAPLRDLGRGPLSSAAEILMAFGRSVRLGGPEGMPSYANLFARVPGDWKYDWVEFAEACGRVRLQGLTPLRIERVEG